MLDRLAVPTEPFSIDLCAYAVVSNRYNLVVRIDGERSATWSPHDVVERWTRLFSGPPWVHRYLREATLSEAERACLD